MVIEKDKNLLGPQVNHAANNIILDQKLRVLFAQLLKFMWYQLAESLVYNWLRKLYYFVKIMLSPISRIQWGTWNQ